VPVDGASAKNAHFDPEGRAGSYAAIYHPWIETRCTSGSVRPLPPDGAILGMIAARTRSRGAWIAPANQTLRSVVALHAELPATRQAVLFDAGINVVLHRPEGYTLMSEDTLSGIPDQRPIHVRRLLMLLRRMMLRLGEEFTFETNGDALRALIRQRCNNMLERLFRAGAFAGRSAAESFQVSVDDADNTLASVDAGRLIVRIRVRPAQALRFITLRFSLGGGATGVSEETAA
jgi:phage tail sheath protein FI